MTVLLGRTSAGTTAEQSTAGNTAAWPFVASVSGDLKYIFAQTKVTNTATAVRFGIYTDNGSGTAPLTLLGVASVDSLTTANTTGVARATLASTVPIVSGTTYWLGWFSATDGRDFQGTSGTGWDEHASADFPATFTTVSSGAVDTIIWGEDAPNPAVSSSFNAIPFMGGPIGG